MSTHYTFHLRVKQVMNEYCYLYHSLSVFRSKQSEVRLMAHCVSIRVCMRRVLMTVCYGDINWCGFTASGCAGMMHANAALT